jgi:hypothetical protein
MRFGAIAAAVALVCAGPASAARYFEFQFKGEALQPTTADDGTQKILAVFTDVLLRYDTLASDTVGVSAGNASYSVTRFAGGLRTNNLPGGNVFNLSFLPTDVPLSETLTPILVSGTFGHILCQRRCGSERRGRITSLSARTSDILPGQIGLFDRTVLVPIEAPEPVTWAMMVLGVGMIGAGMRRRATVSVRYT